MPCSEHEAAVRLQHWWLECRKQYWLRSRPPSGQQWISPGKKQSDVRSFMQPRAISRRVFTSDRPDGQWPEWAHSECITNVASRRPGLASFHLAQNLARRFSVAYVHSDNAPVHFRADATAGTEAPQCTCGQPYCDCIDYSGDDESALEAYAELCTYAQDYCDEYVAGLEAREQGPYYLATSAADGARRPSQRRRVA